MRLRVIAMILTGLALAATSASAQSLGGAIGIYYDTMGTGCDGQIPPGQATDVYILAKPTPGLLGGDGLRGAEFRVKGRPASGWFIGVTPNPNATVTVGDPISNESQPAGSRGGANINFPTCQAPDVNGTVLLYTLSIFATAPINDIMLEVDHKDPPGNPMFVCPLINQCDDPTFTKICISPGRGYANHQAPGSCGPVAVETTTWSEVKSLFN